MRVAIIGTGLIGTSLGLALQEVHEVDEVVGYDRDTDRLTAALHRGGITVAALSATQAVVDADLVVLAVPAPAIAPVADEVAGALRAGAIVTDVASVKTAAVSTLQQALPDDVWLVGGHPMAGSHETGPEHASGELFVGATYLLTPTTHTDPQAYRTLHRLVAGIGARPMAVDPGDHDRLVAVISHLPQLAATTLMNLAADQAQRQHAGLLLLAAGGFRDATRVAASNPQLWLDICAENRAAIVTVLDDYAAQLAQLRATIAAADEERLRTVLMQAQQARRRLPRKAVGGGALVELLLPIPDRPGVLAEVTTSVGAVGVNIEDFSIDHAAEGGRGALRLIIAGAGAAATAAAALKERSYEVRERQL
ncbi:MAG: prephenate dehydrogenase [Actinobacteria bacterium]|nr:prephenate dehydrogenase [Actinomycetota bacterium]